MGLRAAGKAPRYRCHLGCILLKMPADSRCRQAGQEGTHVALQKGEAVRVLKEVSADWWYVEVGRSGERGYVPATYIKDDADG